MLGCSARSSGCYCNETAAGTAEFEDFKDVIVQRLQQEGLTESVIEELRSQAYIDIRLGGG